MRAVLLFREKLVFDDGMIMDIKIWSVDGPVPPSVHNLKYSLFYGRPGQRLIGYDNERGKGDHRHYGLQEETYEFSSLKQLLSDFREDVEQTRGALI